MSHDEASAVVEVRSSKYNNYTSNVCLTPGWNRKRDKVDGMLSMLLQEEGCLKPLSLSGYVAGPARKLGGD